MLKESLEDLELRGKSNTQADQVGRKPKRLRMERLEGWGEGREAGESEKGSYRMEV